MKLIIFFLLCVLSTLNLSAQAFTSNITRLGIGGDVTYLQINSDHVLSRAATGYAGYLESRGELNRFLDVSYAIGIFKHKMEVQEFESEDNIEVGLLGAEIKFLAAFRPFAQKYVTLEGGPSFMLNGEFKIDEKDLERFTGSSNPILMKEFESTNPFNINGVVGASVGIDHFKIMAHYHYSFLDSLNSQDTLGNDIDGNFSFITAGLRIYF